MGINEIIIYIMVFFMAVGALDKCIGNKFGYGGMANVLFIVLRF